MPISVMPHSASVVSPIWPSIATRVNPCTYIDLGTRFTCIKKTMTTMANQIMSYPN